VPANSVRAHDPARLAEVVRLLLVAVAVAVAWSTLGDPRVVVAVTVLAVLTSGVVTERLRPNVTPVAKLDGCATCLDHDPATEV
jgi:hypothetical protein